MEGPGFKCLKERLLGHGSQIKTKNMASSSIASDETVHVILTEDDIPGASVKKNEELEFWLRCRGDSLKGLKDESTAHKTVRASL